MLKFDASGDFQAPDQFVYLCNASGFGPGNFAPIFHLGKGRVKKVVICCGALENSKDALDLKHAIGPANRLLLKLPGLLGIARRDILMLYGDPDRSSGWMAKGSQIRAFAGDLPILANLQGGTKQLALGINDAMRISGAEWARITVTKPPIRTGVTALFGNDFDDRIIPLAKVAEPIPLQLLFELRDLHFDQKGALPKRAAYAKLAGLADSAWTKFTRNDQTAVMDRAKLSEFNGTFYRRDEKSIENNGLDISGVPHDQKAMLRRVFEFDCHPDKVTEKKLLPGFFASFVTGGWLEQAAFNQLTGRFGKSKDFDFTLNVPLRMTEKSDEEGEADILIKHGDCLHVVELKTAASSKQLRGKSRNQAANNRTMIGGDMARSWLVMPFLKDDGVADLQKSCRLSGVTLLAGSDALKELIKEIEQVMRC